MTEGPITSAEAAERVCRKCGSKIFADAPHGFCGLCLFKTALGPVEGDQESDAESIPLKFEPGFDDYELLQEIGRGGQAVVYRARQKSLNRIVALKIIGAGAWGTPGRLKRFRLEAEAAASLNHPSIVPIHDIGEREDCCFFSMNLIDGQRLDEVVGDRPMSSHRAAQLLVKLARTVQYAHDHGILHRDLKPGNILIDQDGEPHLTDFGLARLVETESNVTRTLEFLGTPSYMAPEQARGQNDRLTTTTDVYGLGAVFYQLLTGRPPFVGASAYETVRLLLESEPKSPRLLNPKVDRDLSTVCLKCLEKDAQLRYPSALALAEDLERWLRREPIDARPAGLFTRGSKWLRRNPATAFAIVCLTALIAVLALVVWQTKFVHPPRVTGIAVLPFENLSGNRDGALYADGVQDDILTKLSKIAELKVISRTSVMQYRGPRNLRQIGQALGVSHILEGSVRRDSGKLHLNAQLVDARSDTQIWAEQYDGDLGDLFVIQGKIAQDVAEQLHARISFVEKSAIQRAPTADIAAFDLYTRAKNLFLAATNSNSGKEELLEAADLLNQALTRDRFYFEAYCQLGGIHDLLYILGHDHSPSRLALAKAAVDAALRLRPKAGEAHLARADMLFRGYLNYDQALGELDLARKSLPNDSRVFELAGFIQNRRGHFEQALTEFEHAMALDPRNVYRLEQMGQIYWFCRRYPEVQAVYERALEIEPNNVQLRIYRADLDMAWKADTRAVHQVIDSLRESNPRAIHEIADSWVLCALADRDPTAIRAALIAAGENPPLNDNAMHFSNSFIEGWIARLEQNGPHARSAFEAARAEQEKLAQSQPDYAPPLCILGVIDALLGRKEQALNECQRASELLPVEKDAFNGPIIIQWSAIAAAWVGDNDRALEQLGAAARIPGTLSYGWLKLLPFWDPLRDDPRFNEIVNSLAPR